MVFLGVALVGLAYEAYRQPQHFGFARGEFITRVVLAVGLAGLLALVG
jgi:uncharacterized protein (DUF2235 family)